MPLSLQMQELWAAVRTMRCACTATGCAARIQQPRSRRSTLWEVLPTRLLAARLAGTTSTRRVPQVVRSHTSNRLGGPKPGGRTSPITLGSTRSLDMNSWVIGGVRWPGFRPRVCRHQAGLREPGFVRRACGHVPPRSRSLLGRRGFKQKGERSHLVSLSRRHSSCICSEADVRHGCGGDKPRCAGGFRRCRHRGTSCPFGKCLATFPQAVRRRLNQSPSQ